MNALELKIPPPIVAVTVGLIMWALSLTGFGALHRGRALTIVAIVVAIAGGVISLAGNIAFRRAKTTVNPLKPDKASSLVTGGIYRITRNPMYLGMTFTLAGWAIYLANVPSALAVALLPLYLTRFQIRPEERALLALFGEAYASYIGRVRRWL